jgi:hypothetical protein
VATVGGKYNVEEIISDTELKVKTFEKDDEVLKGKDWAYKIHPKLDQSEVFNHVYTALEKE